MGVKQGEIDTNLHLPSAARLLGFIDDSSMHLEEDDNNNESMNTID
jgi:uncharacterized protein (DUF1499 family)